MARDVRRNQFLFYEFSSYDFDRLIKLVKGNVILLLDNDFDSILATISHVFQSYDK